MAPPSGVKPADSSDTSLELPVFDTKLEAPGLVDLEKPIKLNTFFLDASFGNRGWIDVMSKVGLSPRSLFSESSTYQVGGGFSLNVKDYYPYFRFQYGDAQGIGAPHATMNRWKLELGLEEFGSHRWTLGSSPMFFGLLPYHRMGLSFGTSFTTDVNGEEASLGHTFKLGVVNERELMSLGMHLPNNQALEMGLLLHFPIYLNGREALFNFGGDKLCQSLRCQTSEFESGVNYTPVRLSLRYFVNGIPDAYAPDSKQASMMAFTDNMVTNLSNFQQRRGTVVPVVNGMFGQHVFSFGTEEQYNTLHSNLGVLSLLDGVNEGLRQQDIAQILRYGEPWQKVALAVHEGLWLSLGIYGAAGRDSRYPSIEELEQGKPGVFGDRDRRALRMGLPIQIATDTIGALDGFKVLDFGKGRRHYGADIGMIGVGGLMILFARPLSGGGFISEGDPNNPRSFLRNSAFSDGGILYQEPHDIAKEDKTGGDEMLYAVSAIGGSLIFNGVYDLISLGIDAGKSGGGVGSSNAKDSKKPQVALGGSWAGGKDVFFSFSVNNW